MINSVKTDPKIVERFVKYLGSQEIKGKGFKYKEIKLNYVDFIKPSRANYKTFGNTSLRRKKAEKEELTEYRLFGLKVGTEKKIIYDLERTFIITLLNRYDNYKVMLGTIIHEFTHLYLFLKIGNHYHKDQEWQKQLKIFNKSYLNYYGYANLRSGEIPSIE